MLSNRVATSVAVMGLALIPALVRAQQQMPPVVVTAPSAGPQVPAAAPEVERFALPQTRESIDQKKIESTVNIIDSEDSVKYLPSLLLRKRNYGDTQPTMATRMWGINSSARNLVYVDDMPISALVSNNNTNGAPRWGLVSPEEIKGADMLYGPFSAAYPGNSIGGVLLISTRMPEKLEATAKQTFAFQNFSYYQTSDTYMTSNSAATIGSKVGKLSFFLAVNRQESFSQPLAFITNATTPAGTTGAIGAQNKTGGSANVVGAGGLLHTIMNNYKLKLAVDVTDWLRASYTIGFWDNTADSSVQTYLKTANGSPTFGSVAGFASNTYKLGEQHLMNAVSLKTDTKGMWDWELIATRYDYLHSMQRTPAGVLAGGTSFTTTGLVARQDGSGWTTLDAKAIWRPTGPEGNHEVSFGGHHDHYTLNNPTYNSTNWLNTPDNGNGTLSTFGTGKTETWALWAQDAWRFAPDWKLTLGGRMEWWRAYDGYNLSGTVGANQPVQQATSFSPKATLGWQIDPAWSTKFSFGQAYRNPTVAELYQIVSTGATFAIPNPNLVPESALSYEFSVERQDKNSRLRISLFQEDTSNALISQTSQVNNTFVTTFQNVAKIRNRGVELVGELKDVLIEGLSFSNSLTFVDSMILSNPGFVTPSNSPSVGMWVPYVPQWRDTAQVTYQANERLAMSLAGRYQGKMYSTLDNTAYVSGVQAAFDPFFVMDVKLRYQIVDAVSFEAGVDNLTDAKYFLFHPFPGRTYLASLKLKL